MVIIKKNSIYNLAFLYLFLPVFLFLLFWCKWYISLISCSILIYVFYRIFKNNQRYNDSISIRKIVFILIGILLLLWCILGGQGGLYYQSSDWGCRNAVFKDMIFNDPPIFYGNNSFLCYYIGHWIVPSLLGKSLLMIHIPNEIVWKVSNLFLLFWTFLGVLLTYFLINFYLEKKGTKSQLIILVSLILFSGLDVLGLLIRNGSFSTHIEPWNIFYQFSSNTTQLFWVFNQAIPAWIGTLLIVSDSDIKKDAVVGVLLVLFSPFPLFGCFAIVCFKVIENYFLIKKFKKFLKDIFTLENILSVLFIFPILASYIFSNTKAGNGSTLSGFNLHLGNEGSIGIIMLIAFLFVEYGIYLLFVYKNNKNNYLFYAVFFILPLIASFRFGTSNDFEMRASIPLLFIVMLMVINELCNQITFKHKKIIFTLKGLVLTSVFLLGSITPLIEFYRGYNEVRTKHTIRLTDESVELSEKTINFVSSDYKKTNFYKYFGK